MFMLMMVLMLAAGNEDRTVTDVMFKLIGDSFLAPQANDDLKALMATNPKLDLWETAAVGSVADLRDMLDRDPSRVQARNRFGWTPLHFASFAGNRENVQLLLQRGADIGSRAQSKFRNTPLQVAMLTGQYDTAKLLLDRGADVLDRQAEGVAPIHEAAALGRADLIELLLDRGAEITSRTDDGETALSLAVKRGHQKAAELLRARGARD